MTKKQRKIIWLARQPDVHRAGDRALAEVLWLVRMWAQLRGKAEDSWCEERHGFWDQAVRGSVALFVARRRLFTDAACVLTGIAPTTLALDVEAFYDSLQVPTAIHDCLTVGFDPVVRIMASLLDVGPAIPH